jgi:nucleoside-diphosphate-sugar epimerase
MAAIKLKHIQLPDSMKRAMARQAEAEGGSMAAAALGAASGIMMARPLALQLRNLQSLVEMGADKNITVVFPAPLMTIIAELHRGAGATPPTEEQGPSTSRRKKMGAAWTCSGTVTSGSASLRTPAASAATCRHRTLGREPMSEGALHVVFGTGQVGLTLAALLAGRGVAVRAVSRHRPAALADGVGWRAADATDREAAVGAANGASVVYQCLNAPYTQWPELFPPLQQGALTAAERTGALLVTLENVYAYGPAGGKPMTEDLPLAATTSKGRIRAAMTAELLAAAEAGRVRIAIGRASDFFGAGVTESSLGERVFGNALAGKRADFIGNPDRPHTYSYVPDIAAGLETLGTDERAVGQVWHLPGPETVTTRALLDLVAGEVSHPVGIRNLPKLVMRALGLVNPLMRELAEMAYEFEEPFVLDTTKYESTFGTAVTPLAAAITHTIDWYRTRAGAK